MCLLRQTKIEGVLQVKLGRLHSLKGLRELGNTMKFHERVPNIWLKIRVRS